MLPDIVHKNIYFNIIFIILLFFTTDFFSQIKLLRNIYLTLSMENPLGLEADTTAISGPVSQL